MAKMKSKSDPRSEFLKYLPRQNICLQCIYCDYSVCCMTDDHRVQGGFRLGDDVYLECPECGEGHFRVVVSFVVEITSEMEEPCEKPRT